MEIIMVIQKQDLMHLSAKSVDPTRPAQAPHWRIDFAIRKPEVYNHYVDLTNRSWQSL